MLGLFIKERMYIGLKPSYGERTAKERTAFLYTGIAIAPGNHEGSRRSPEMFQPLAREEC